MNRELTERRIASWRSRVDFNHPSGCHIWTGYVHQGGYGNLGGLWAHRIAVELDRGPIPIGMVVDHLCRVPLCVNPDHLEVVSQQENFLRGTSTGAQATRRNACMQGHEFTTENAYVRRDGRGRNCRTCTTERRRAAAARRASERAVAEAIRLTEEDEAADKAWAELPIYGATAAYIARFAAEDITAEWAEMNGGAS